MRKKLLFALILFILCVLPVWSQTVGSAQRQDFFIAPLFELTGYSKEGVAYGGGLAIGAGDGVAIGMRLLLSGSSDSVNTLEIGLFCRFYLFGRDYATGPFVQFDFGAAIYTINRFLSLPTEFGALSGGITAGWRFPILNWLSLEVAVRGGHPYVFGAGVSVAFRL